MPFQMDNVHVSVAGKGLLVMEQLAHVLIDLNTCFPAKGGKVFINEHCCIIVVLILDDRNALV